MFKSVHPSYDSSDRRRKGVFIDSTAVRRGRNDESEATYVDTKYVRCQQCGFMCHADRDTRIRKGSYAGDGNDYESYLFNNIEAGSPVGLLLALTYAAGVGGQTDPTTEAGCPFCGSYRFM